jgi:fatty-acyl-CoA synthase
MPGREVLNMEKLCHVIADEKVTFTAGVPTIWMMLNDYLEKGGWHDFSSLKGIFSGGSACPISLMKNLNEKYGFPIRQAYGMTETSPLATAAVTKSYMSDWPMDKIYDIRSSAGIPAPGVEMRIVGEDGKDVKMDGKEWGEIWFRGPWIAKDYYKDDASSTRHYSDGWLKTGDVATMDDEGYVRLVDRKGDLIKSGGEWISSVDLENEIMSHPKVFEASVIGIPHEKWQERPMGCIVPAPGESLTSEDIRAFLLDRIAEWQIPDTFVFLPMIPKTSVGKFDKKQLRKMWGEGSLK